MSVLKAHISGRFFWSDSWCITAVKCLENEFVITPVTEALIDTIMRNPNTFLA